MNETEFVFVFSTVDSLESAESIASNCVAKKLVACAQIDGPITSVYRWNGQIETGSEYRLIFKTSTELIGALETAVKESHAYEVPEFIVIPIVSGSAAYLSWMRESLLD